MSRVLIIDDDRLFCDVLMRVLARAGHHSTFCLTLADGLRELAVRDVDLVLLDVQLPDGNGLESIDVIKEAPSAPLVIILTGMGNPDGAESAIRWGAWDYIEKPASAQDVLLPVARALTYREEKRSNSHRMNLNRQRIIGESPAMRVALDQLARAAQSDVNVLITGETGTGKELFARALHENSPRRNSPFVVVDCAALPEQIVESLIFGHERGAFTGADRSHEGLIKQADGGTLFLDEIGELPPVLQKSFLRVLQDRRFRPVGSRREETSNFRLVAATNRNLDEMVGAGVFRSDLLFRLRSFVIELPPLRERKDDIGELVSGYLAKACEQAGIPLKGSSSDLVKVMEAYEWPGNVRELFATLQSALTSAYEHPVLYPCHLPIEVRVAAAKSSVSGKPEQGPACALWQEEIHLDGRFLPYREFRARVIARGEREYFLMLCRAAGGSAREASRLSGLSRSRLYHFLQSYGLSLREVLQDS